MKSFKSNLVESGLIATVVAAGSTVSSRGRLAEVVDDLPVKYQLMAKFLFLQEEGLEKNIRELFGDDLVNELIAAGIAISKDNLISLRSFVLRIVGSNIFFAERSRVPEVYFGDDTMALYAYNVPTGREEVTLDLCTGGGYQAITSLNWAKSAYGVDANARAISVAKINAKINGLEQKVIFFEDDCISFLKSTAIEFNTLFFNPPMLPDAGGKDRMLSFPASGGDTGTQLIEQILDLAARNHPSCKTIRFIGVFLKSNETFLIASCLQNLAELGWNSTLLVVSKHSLEDNSSMLLGLATDAAMHLKISSEITYKQYQDHFSSIGATELFYGFCTCTKADTGKGEFTIVDLCKEGARNSFWMAT